MFDSYLQEREKTGKQKKLDFPESILFLYN